MAEPPTSTDRPPRTGLVVTNVIKLGGLAVVLHEVFVQPAIRPSALAIAALMMAGGVGVESFFRSFFGSKE